MQYIWLIWSLLLLFFWFIIYKSLNSKEKRIEMLNVSLWTSLFGLTEPLFVPRYWSPPSLFNLATNTGFDIESLIFAFAIGGIAVIIYELIFKNHHSIIPKKERHAPKHRFHLWILFSTPIIFIILYLTTKLNPIYSSIVAMTVGGLTTWYCRPDLKRKMVISSFLFLGIYFIYFLTLIYVSPHYVESVWNFQNISGILIAKIPIEELLFAWSFGFIWSSLYEHIKWKRVV